MKQQPKTKNNTNEMKSSPKIIPKKVLFAALAAFIVLTSVLEFRYCDFSPFPISGNWQTTDQYIEIPVAYHDSKEAYFVNDFSVTEFVKIYPSALFGFLADIYNTIGNMFITYVLVFLALKVIYVGSLFLLAKTLLHNERTALLATGILSFSHFMGLEEIGIIEVVPKSFFFAFVPLLIYVFIKKPKLYPAIFASLGILAYFHPISAIPLTMIFLYSFLEKGEFKKIVLYALIFFLFFSPCFLSSFMERKPFDTSAMFANSYYRPVNSLITVAKYVPLMILGLFAMRNFDARYFRWSLLLICYSLLSVIGLFNDTFLMIGFFRAMKFVIFFSLIFSSYYIIKIYKRSLIAGLMLFILVFLPFSSVFNSTPLEGITKARGPYINEVSSVMDMGMWFEKNTDRNAIIMVPSDWGSIRPWSKRAIVISDSDTFLAAVNAEISTAVKERYLDMKAAYNQSSVGEYVRTALKYNASYIVTYDKDIGLPKTAEFGNFAVYSITG